MFIEKLIANNFRNYKNLFLEFDKNKPINLIHSPNGMGKSNLLEMIYYLSYLRSFRNVLDKELINQEDNFFFIKSLFIEKDYINEIQIKYKNKKEVLLNNKKINRYLDIFGKVLSVLFCNEDIYIIVGSPVIKRKFFDIFISIYDKNYLKNLQKYNEILKQKNNVLKNKKDEALISVYNKQLANIIFYIQKSREGIIEKINSVFNNIYYSIGMFNNNVKIIYTPSIKKENISAEEIQEILEKNKKKELLYGYSLSGTHRDNYSFIINGIQFEKYASLGQVRLAALVLKLIKAEYLKKIFNTCPVLLLDDVILELDYQKQERFIKIISEYNQLFITVTRKDYINLFMDKERINEIEIENGTIKKNN